MSSDLYFKMPSYAKSNFVYIEVTKGDAASHQSASSALKLSAIEMGATVNVSIIKRQLVLGKKEAEQIICSNLFQKCEIDRVYRCQLRLPRCSSERHVME